MKHFLLAISLFFSIGFTAQTKEVELVISSGLMYAQSNSFSKDGKYLVSSHLKNIYIWDVKTGREIRRTLVTDSDIHTLDSAWFSPDNKKVIVGLMMSNDQYHVDVLTGESVFVKSDVPYDYTQPFKKNVMMKANEHMASSSKKDMVFKSPDGKHELRLRKVKNPYDPSGVVPHMYMTVLKSGNKETAQPDTNYLADIAFSADSKLVYSNKKIYNLETHRMVSELKLAPYAPMGVAFLPGTHIPVTGAQDNIRIWDFPKIRNIPLKGLAMFKFSPGYTHLVADIYDPKSKSKKQVRVSLEKEKILKKISSPSEMGYITDVGTDGKTYCLTDVKMDKNNPLNTKYSGLVMNAVNGKLIKRYKNATQLLNTADLNQYIVDSVASDRHIADVQKGRVRELVSDTASDPYFYYYVYNLSNDKKYALGYITSQSKTNEDGDLMTRVAAWDMTNGQRVFDQWVDGISLLAYQVSSDHSLYAVSNYAGDILIYDFKTGKKLMTLEGHTTFVQELAFSDDSKRLISGSMDGTRRVWNLETGKEQVSLISIGKEDYAIVTPDQYYYSTKGATQNIHFVKGMEIFPFAQFDLKYNRPDIILERMMASNQEMIRPYNLAYKKRLKRLGFSEEMLSGEFHMPEIEITNSSKFPITTSSPELELSVRCIDTKYKLDRIIIRINGVPIHGKKGLSIKELDVRSIGKRIKLELASGSNSVSASVMNEKGVESLVDHFEIAYHPTTEKLPDLHLFTIGVSKYKSGEFDLKYAAKDANDLSALFGGEHAPFNKVYSHHLTDDQVTGSAVQQLGKALENTAVNDVVCVFFAGHGLLDADLNYFLASHDVNFENPSNGGIPYESLEDLLDGIPARNKLLLIDACHSGEIDKEEVALVENTQTAHEDVVFRAVGSNGLQQVGLSNSFELMKELFTDIRKSSGAMIISSAGGTEYAMEGDQWNNGVFTYCLLNGLKNGDADLDGDKMIMMSEVNDYVRAKVWQLTGGRQQPTNRAEAIEVDFRLW